MRINYNQSAVLANSCLNRNDKSLSASTERLSSGLKINHAKDNAAGLAISNRMDSQIRGLRQAKDNTNDGISVVETADGALSEISSIIQRMNQLSVQAADGVKTDEDRRLIDAEMQQLKEEITRIATDTQFNGQSLLDGSFDLKGYTDNEDVKVNYYSDNVKAGAYSVDIGALFNADGSANTSALTGFPTDNLEAKKLDDGTIKITAANDFEIRLWAADGAAGQVNIDITGIGAMKIQSGVNEGQELAVRIQKISLENMGIANLTLNPTYDENGDEVVSATDNSQAAIEMIKRAQSYINDARARLGAYENRMEHNVSNLDISSENMTSSYSRIMDVDMAEEMTEYTTMQVLSQAGISMLSQANERPQQVLQLLQ